MSNDLTKRNDLTKPTKPERQKSDDVGSRLKHELMADALNRLFGHDESIEALTRASLRASSSRLPITPTPPSGTAPRHCSVRCSRRQPTAAC